MSLSDLILSLINWLSSGFNETSNLLSIQAKITDIEKAIKILKNTIKDKNISIQNKYITNILVKENEYVNPGMPLIMVYDISKTIYKIQIIKEDFENIDNKEIYVNGTINKDFKLYKKSLVRNKNNLSTHYIELISSKSKSFGNILSFEFK